MKNKQELSSPSHTIPSYVICARPFRRLTSNSIRFLFSQHFGVVNKNHPSLDNLTHKIKHLKQNKNNEKYTPSCTPPFSTTAINGFGGTLPLPSTCQP